MSSEFFGPHQKMNCKYSQTRYGTEAATIAGGVLAGNRL